MAGRVSAAGPFFIVAGSARRSSERHVSYTATGAGVRQSRENLTIFVTLLVDPKIHVVPGTCRMTVLEAADENGKSLLDAAPLDYAVNTDALYVIGTGINLSSSAVSGSVQRLRGILHITMVTKSETWEVPALEAAAGTAKTLTTTDGPEQLTVVSAQPQDRGYRVTLTYQGPTLGLEFRPASSLIFGALHLTDSLGNTVTGFTGSVRGSRADAGTNPTYTAEVTFSSQRPDRLTPPLKLTWQLPVSLAQVDLPFEFTNLPLP